MYSIPRDNVRKSPPRKNRIKRKWRILGSTTMVAKHKKDFIYQKDIDTPGEMLYKNCLWIGRRKIDQKKLKPLVSNTQTMALNSISLAISNECDLLNWLSILYDRMYCNRIRSPVYGAKNAHRVTAHFRKTVSFQRTWNRYRNSITGDFSHVIRRAGESLRPLLSKRIGFHSVHENRSANCCIYLKNSQYSHFPKKWFYYWFSPPPPFLQFRHKFHDERFIYLFVVPQFKIESAQYITF